MTIVAGCLVVNNGLVLMIRTDHGWELPGGHVEDLETLKEGAIRETLEETGVLCDSLETLYKETEKSKKIVYFLAKYRDGQLMPQKSEGIKEVSWKRPVKAFKDVVSLQRDVLKVFCEKIDGCGDK